MVSLACHWLDLTKEAARPEEREKNRAGNKLNELFLLEQVRSERACRYLPEMRCDCRFWFSCRPHCSMRGCGKFSTM